MTTAVIQQIKREVITELIEQFITPILQDIKDPEGEYRPEFVKDILHAVHEPKLGAYSAKELNKLLY